jgi:hypothetical protein
MRLMINNLHLSVDILQNVNKNVIYSSICIFNRGCCTNTFTVFGEMNLNPFSFSLNFYNKNTLVSILLFAIEIIF